MTRRFALILLTAAAILGGTVTAGVIWRVPLAQLVLDWALKDLGIPGARVTVEHLSTDRFRAKNLAAGKEAEFTVESIDVDFHLPEVLRGLITKVAVDGLGLTLDLREGAMPLGSLQTFFERLREDDTGDGAAFPLEALPAIEVRDGRIRAETPYGPANLALEGAFTRLRTVGPTLHITSDLDSDWARLNTDLSVTGDPRDAAQAHIAMADGAINLPDHLIRLHNLTGDVDLRIQDGGPRYGEGELAANGLTLAGAPFDQARAHFTLSREQAELSAQLRSEDGSFDLAFDSRVEALDTAPRLSFNLRSDIGESAPVWAFARRPFPTGGNGQIEVQVFGRNSIPPPLTTNADELQDWLEGGSFSGVLTGRLSGLELPGTVAEAAVQADLDATHENRELRLTTRQKSRVSVSGLATEDLAALGVPANLADEVIGLTGGAFAITLPAPSQPSAALVWHPDDPARNARFDGSAVITAGPLTATLIGETGATLLPVPALVDVDLREASISASDVTIRGQKIEELQVTGRLAGTARSFEANGRLNIGLAAPNLSGLSAAHASLSLPFQVRRDGSSLDLALSESGLVIIDGLAAAAGLTTEGPVELVLTGAEANFTLPYESSSLALAHTTRFELPPTRLLWQGEKNSPIPLELSVPNLEIAGELTEDGLYRGKTALRKATLALPESDLAFEGLSADVEFSGNPESAAANFEVAAVRHLASPAFFAPLHASGQTARRGDRLELTVAIDRADGVRFADVAATHDLSTGSGQGDITLLPLRFQPGSLQPAALSPLLASTSDASGSVEGLAALTWNSGSLAGTARIVVRDLAFSWNDARVSGLNLDLDLDNLEPLTSPPQQLLSADLIDVGVPLKDVVARFRLLPESPARILVEEASFSTVGSHITVHDTIVDPRSDQLETQLLVDEVDVGVLFDVLAVDGLSGTGELVGTIPIMRDGDRVVIENARLEADGPGVLRFRSDAAARALAGGGEHVDLVIQALKDFHYQNLTLTGNLDRAGEAKLRLEILGNNPEVLDGYPFQLNINLTGNPEPILEVLQLSRTLFRDILGRARTLSR